MTLTRTFKRFFAAESASAVVMVICAIASICIANSPAGSAYLELWQRNLGGLTLAHWINDGLMTIFFLLVGLELERELYSGELSSPRQAALPVVAALGGMLTPALIYYVVNFRGETQSGLGIPMATDIAFATAVLALLGRHVPASLKVFVVAFAVVDDLGAIIVIAVFYTPHLASGYLFAAAAVFLLLILLNRVFRVMALLPYLVGGAALWYCMLKSGVHATIAGVLLAFAIPYSSVDEDTRSPSCRLENLLHSPVAFLVLPLFALANTAIVVESNWMQELASNNSAGIIAGLVVGKPLGVACFCAVGVWCSLCRLPPDMSWRHIAGAGLLGGIGFTMAIFIANLAFPSDIRLVESSKVAILTASIIAGSLGYAWLRFFASPNRNQRTGDL